MKKLIPLLIAILLASLLAGCSSDSDEEEELTGLISLVPSQANLLGSMDLTRSSEDASITTLFEESEEESGGPQTIEDILAKTVEADEFEEIALFLDLSVMAETEDVLGMVMGDDMPDLSDLDIYFGTIAKGTFDKGELIAALETAGEDLSISSPGDYTTYSDLKGWVLAFLSEDTFVMGAMQSVEDVIAMKEGSKSHISGEVLDIYNNLGDALFKLAMVAPEGLSAQDFQTETADEGMISMDLDLSMLEDMESAGLAFDEQGDSFLIDALACFASKESAEELKGFIEMIAGFIDGLEPDIKVKDNCVTLDLEITKEMIENMFKSMFEDMFEGSEESWGE